MASPILAVNRGLMAYALELSHQVTPRVELKQRMHVTDDIAEITYQFQGVNHWAVMCLTPASFPLVRQWLLDANRLNQYMASVKKREGAWRAYLMHDDQHPVELNMGAPFPAIATRTRRGNTRYRSVEQNLLWPDIRSSITVAEIALAIVEIVLACKQQLDVQISPRTEDIWIDVEGETIQITNYLRSWADQDRDEERPDLWSRVWDVVDNIAYHNFGELVQHVLSNPKKRWRKISDLHEFANALEARIRVDREYVARTGAERDYYA